jgi:antitoxin VapB
MMVYMSGVHMPFYIRDPETDALVRKLARSKGIGLTEAVRLAALRALDEERKKEPLHERIAKITEALKAYPRTGKKADKAFFDEMWQDD